MQAIKAYTQIYADFKGQDLINKLEQVARTCYKPENKIKEGDKSNTNSQGRSSND